MIIRCEDFIAVDAAPEMNLFLILFVGDTVETCDEVPEDGF